MRWNGNNTDDPVGKTKQKCFIISDCSTLNSTLFQIFFKIAIWINDFAFPAFFMCFNFILFQRTIQIPSYSNVDGTSFKFCENSVKMSSCLKFHRKPVFFFWSPTESVFWSVIIYKASLLLVESILCIFVFFPCTEQHRIWDNIGQWTIFFVFVTQIKIFFQNDQNLVILNFYFFIFLHFKDH